MNTRITRNTMNMQHYEYDFAMQASGKPDAKAAKIAIAEVSCYHG